MMLLKNVSLTVIMLCFLSKAYGEIYLSDHMIKATHEMSEWIEHFEQTLEGKEIIAETGVTECKRVEEIQNTYLCFSDDLMTMNNALVRATVFIEGGVGADKGELILESSYAFNANARGIQGHDLQGKDLVNYYTIMMEKCSKDDQYCPSDVEKEYFSEFILPMAQNGNFVVITFALRSTSMGIDEVVTHEIMHAQYFMDERYQTTIDQYWENLETETKEEIKWSLSCHYDKSDDLLMKNEFQAYILMANAHRNLLGHMVDTHRNSLMEMLKEKRVNPIQVQF